MDCIIIGNLTFSELCFVCVGVLMLTAAIFAWFHLILTTECPPEIRSLRDKIDFYRQVCDIESERWQDTLQKKQWEREARIRSIACAAVKKKDDERFRKRIEAESLRQQDA